MSAVVRPTVLVARAVFDDVIERLRQHFEVQHNQADAVWSQDELIQRLQGKDGAFVTGTEAIDAAAAGRLPATAGGVLDGGGLQQHRPRRLHRARRAGQQRARRADRDHRRLRLRADDGRGAAHQRERTFPARRRVDALGPRHVRRRRRARRHARRAGHGPHRPGHRAARRAGLRHAGDLSQPLAAGPGDRGSSSARATSPRTSCCARPTTWCWCCPTARTRTMPSARPSWR